MRKKYREMLDFSSWTISEYQQLSLMNEEELSQAESDITGDIMNMSQIEQVRMVLTYKNKINQLEERK